MLTSLSTSRLCCRPYLPPAPTMPTAIPCTDTCRQKAVCYIPIILRLFYMFLSYSHISGTVFIPPYSSHPIPSPIYCPISLIPLLNLAILYLYHRCPHSTTYTLPNYNFPMFLPTTIIVQFSLFYVFDYSAPHNLLSSSCALRLLLSSSFYISTVTIL